MHSTSSPLRNAADRCVSAIDSTRISAAVEAATKSIAASGVEETLECPHRSVGQRRLLLVMRLYWPKPEALDGKWVVPPLQRVG